MLQRKFNVRNLSSSIKQIILAKPTQYALKSMMISYTVFNGLKFFKSDIYCYQDQPTFEQLKWQIFTDESYQEAMNRNSNIVIIVNQDQYIDSFISEVNSFLQQFNQFVQMTKQAKVEFFRLDFENNQQKKEFEKTYNCRLDSDPIMLLKNKYTSGFYPYRPQDFYENKEFLFKYFRKLQKLNKKFETKFFQNLKEITSHSKIIFCKLPKDHQNYQFFKKKFAALSLEFDTQDVHFILVNDKDSIQKLNLQNGEDGQLFFVQKSSKDNFYKKDLVIDEKKFMLQPSLNISQKFSDILEQFQSQYSKSHIFANSGFVQKQTKYSFVIETDRNKLDSKNYSDLINLVGQVQQQVLDNKELQSEFQFEKLNKTLNKGSSIIYIRDNEKFQQRLLAHEFRSINDWKEADTKILDEPHSYRYKFENTLTRENLIQFIEDFKNNQLQEHYKSQQPPNYRKYSQKLVGKTFEEKVQKNQSDQAVFLFSKRCHACKKYGSKYEDLCLDYLKREDNSIIFNRMNNDNNDIKSCEAFNYTPVFMMFKKNYKTHPYVYRSAQFTPDLLKNFFEVTRDFQLIDPQLLDLHLSQRQPL